jgi:heme A synthase
MANASAGVLDSARLPHGGSASIGDIRPRYARYAWGVLAFNLLVILWGAFVRATGSGAGCGRHWPLCNGEVVPRSPALTTAIEFTHRLTSGMALLMVAMLVVGAWRAYPRGHRVRRGAGLSALFIVTEALLGAGLVMFQMVASNPSTARGVWVAGHLSNTYLLVAALALTAWWASGYATRVSRRPSTVAWLCAVTLASMLALGMSGAITALGDTLFPPTSLADAKAQALDPAAHVFVRLRIWHPTFAVVVAVLVLVASVRAATAQSTPGLRSLAWATAALCFAQLFVGMINVALLAPVALQLLHLLLADLLWISFLLLTSTVIAGEREQ